MPITFRRLLSIVLRVLHVNYHHMISMRHITIRNENGFCDPFYCFYIARYENDSNNAALNFQRGSLHCLMECRTTREYERGARVVGFELFGVHELGLSGCPAEPVYNPKAKRRPARRPQGTDPRAFPIVAADREGGRRGCDQIPISSDSCIDTK
jgi:hypothetical protein